MENLASVLSINLVSNVNEVRNESAYDGFSTDLLFSADAKRIAYYKAMLIDKCRMKRGAATIVARYIYEETQGVFNENLKTNEMFQWLKDHFNLQAEKFNFYKACEKLENYRKRK